MGPERILPAQQFAFTAAPNNDGRASNDNTYAIGDEVLVQVTFSTDVTGTGSPRLELNVGGGDGKPASYSGVNGASRLLFSYTVVEGHEDTNGISINANKLTHNGATIVDAADSTKNAVLTHGVEPADPDHKVDGVRPVFQSATIFPADPDRIVLRYDESLSPSLAPTAFEVTVNGETRNPDSVTHFPVDGVTFVFGSDFRAGDDVEISYTVPATNPSGQPAGNRAPLVAPAHPAAVAPPEGYGSEARRSGRAFGVYQCRPGRPKWKFRLERTHRRFARRARASTIQNPDVNDTRLAVSAIASPCLAGDPMVTWRAWGIPVRCGAGMVALQTLIALYRFGDSTALLQLVNPLMWIGLGLFFVTGWVIGWVVERLLRGTTGRFRTLLLGATFLATPVAVAGSLVGGLFGPPGVLLYGLIPYLLLVGIPRLIGVVWTRHGS